MRARELRALRRNLTRLTRTQKQLVAELTAEECQVASVAVIEGACVHRKCPYCDAERIVKNGTADGRQRFKCRAGAKTFNALTGTPLAHLHRRGKWLEQAAVMRDGLSLTPGDATSKRRQDNGAKHGLSKEQVPVRVARDRSGATADFILSVDNASHVVAALKPILPPDAILCTDSRRTLIAAT